MTRLRISLSVGAITLAGCGILSVNRIPINQPPHALSPRPVETVEVFSAARPERPFVDVAYLETDLIGTSDPGRMLAALRSEAARIGCDAIVFSGASSRDKTEAQHGYAATCIVYANP